MYLFELLVVSSLLVNVAWTQHELDFPPGFKFGAATAAYQVEGGWNAADKSPNIWDVFTSVPGRIEGNSNGAIACDSYHQWRRDIEIARELGLDFYRFSIAWSRLLPSGFSNKISEDGRNFYSNLIDGLIQAGIDPVVTLYHWDMPQCLSDLGGWANPLSSDWFADYARVAFNLYGDRVKTWITINEPMIHCSEGYSSGSHAPGIAMPELANYLCNKHILLAHGKAWRIYDNEFRDHQKGKVAITNHFVWYEPETPEHEDLAELARQYGYGRFLHPIHSAEGGWPPMIEELVARNSQQQGYARSRLPAFTEEEKELLKGTHDYLGFNHYTSLTVRKRRPGESIGDWSFGGAPELDAVFGYRDTWAPTASYWFKVNPEGMRKCLAWLHSTYGNNEVFITENGYSSATPEDDVRKINFYRDYLGQLLLSVKEDGVNITAYTAWTLIDNFEWADGYSRMFGLYEVDFNSPERTRTPRPSAKYYGAIVAARSLNVNETEFYED